MLDVENHSTTDGRRFAEESSFVSQDPIESCSSTKPKVSNMEIDAEEEAARHQQAVPANDNIQKKQRQSQAHKKGELI